MQLQVCLCMDAQHVHDCMVADKSTTESNPTQRQLPQISASKEERSYRGIPAAAGWLHIRRREASLHRRSRSPRPPHCRMSAARTGRTAGSCIRSLVAHIALGPVPVLRHWLRHSLQRTARNTAPRGHKCNDVLEPEMPDLYPYHRI